MSNDARENIILDPQLLDEDQAGQENLESSDYVDLEENTLESDDFEEEDGQSEEPEFNDLTLKVPRGFEVDEKYLVDGKPDITKIYKSASDLQKELSRKNNELGDLRKLTDQYLQSQLNTTAATKQKEESQFDEDSFYDDPKQSIERILEQKLNPLQDKLNAYEVKERTQEFFKNHPDFQTDTQSPEFANWVQASKYRQNLAQRADRYDFDAADELAQAFSEVKGSLNKATDHTETQRKEALKQASSESGVKASSSKKIIRRSDLFKMMRENRDAYNEPAFQEELMKAYTEGRVK